MLRFWFNHWVVRALRVILTSLEKGTARQNNSRDWEMVSSSFNTLQDLHPFRDLQLTIRYMCPKVKRYLYVCVMYMCIFIYVCLYEFIQVLKHAKANLWYSFIPPGIVTYFVVLFCYNYFKYLFILPYFLYFLWILFYFNFVTFPGWLFLNSHLAF